MGLSIDIAWFTEGSFLSYIGWPCRSRLPHTIIPCDLGGSGGGGGLVSPVGPSRCKVKRVHSTFENTPCGFRIVLIL